MLICLMVAVLLGVLNALLAAAVWNFIPNVPERPRWIRLVAAALGAAGGAALAMPQLHVAVELLGFEGEGAGLVAGFAYLLALPLITGIAGWLFAEMLGGRSRRPFLALVAGTSAALVASTLVFVPIFLRPEAEAWLSHPLVLGVTIGGSVLGLYWESKRSQLQPAG